MASPKVKDLILRSPAGNSETVTFSWPLQFGTGADRHDNGVDIIETIKFVCADIPGIRSAFEETDFNEIDTANFTSMTNLVDKFNKAVDSIVTLEKGTSLPNERLNKFAEPNLLKHIIQLVYNAAVLDPDKLNNYEPFSPEVYGETSYELVEQMIKHVGVTPDDTFIDLGSGVGQVVLQMAGSFPLKACVGIEKADNPSRYAELMDHHFRVWMNWFGKRYGEYQLIKGDFLVDEHREKITSSSLVFVNNFAFGPNVDHQLKERFADLRDGARIVSSKSFCPLNFRITDRNLSDIGTIMHVSEIPPLKGSVSWTCKPVSYYLHDIDRTKLERYFQRMKNIKGDDTNSNGVATTRTTRDRAKREANNTNHNTQKMGGSSSESETDTQPVVPRRAWSDWCSSKGGKSSQSDDEENNNFTSASNSRNIRASTQKKRKKLTRKAAVITKNAIAAEKIASSSSSTPFNPMKETPLNNVTTNGVTVTTAAAKKAPAAKGGRKGRGKRSLKIAGLDVLHNQTILSTTADIVGKKLPPARGTVDQKLTSLTGMMSHEELEIPTAADIPYGLQILLNNMKNQFLGVIEKMKSKSYADDIEMQIERERERQQWLKNRQNQLEKQIKVLIDDSVVLLKTRMGELGINDHLDLLLQAKEIVHKHRELAGKASKYQKRVEEIEREQRDLVTAHLQSLRVKQKKQDELTPEAAHELVFREIINTFDQRSKYRTQIPSLENEIVQLGKTVEERRAAIQLLAQQGQHLTVTANAPSSNHSSPSSSSSTAKHSKSSRRSREHRTRSQEWPDVPDVGKIEESNPEVLAQKILETGRQIEAGKFPNGYKPQKDEKKSIRGEDRALMPAPPPQAGAKQLPNHHASPKSSNKASNGNNNATSKLIQESPKVCNFESRLKSIITTALNEGHEQRKPPSQAQAEQPKKAATPKMSATHPSPSPSAVSSTHPHHAANINNIITVATQGLTHLNATTTISPITPLTSGYLPTQQQFNQMMQQYKTAAHIFPVIGGGPPAGKHPSAVSSTSSAATGQPPPVSSSSASTPSSSTGKYSKNLTVNVHHPHHGSQQQQSQPPPPTSAASSSSASLHHHSPSSATIYAQQQAMAAAAAAELAYRRTLEQHHQQLQHQHQHRDEFKTPENIRATIEENIRTQTALSESALFYNAARDRLQLLERGQVPPPTQQQLQQAQQQQQPSRPSSSSSQPDYTQVSPAKMALRRHLSQEKLAQQHPGQANVNTGSNSAKTIGDLVNGEIERTLEISHQSIINAAVNMSTVGAGSTSMINPNAQRPERVNVRLLEESPQQRSNVYSPISPRPNSCDNSGRKSPAHGHGQNNLATLAQVATFNHSGHAPSAPPPAVIASERKGRAYSTSGYQQSSAKSGSIAPGNGRRDYVTVQLPRMDIKSHNIGSYFNEDQKVSRDDRPSPRMMNGGGNPQFEGLAASLQARVIASMQIKEEEAEQQRRSELQYQNSAAAASSSSSSAAASSSSSHSLKRTSPIVPHHPRPAKIPHYSASSDASHAHPHHDQLMISASDFSSSGRRSNASSSQEPPLMSPEINSLMSEERTRSRGSAASGGSSSTQPHHPSLSRQSRNDDDDVLPDDEAHWQDRISSGFDRLVAFASTELDKTRRSIDNDTAPSISCNTSPDSGITHSSGDARTFLSTSSSSSQLDLPIVSNGTGDHIDSGSKCLDTVPIIKTSPADDALESPPLSEIGLPRTPSPSATPPLASIPTAGLYSSTTASAATAAANNNAAPAQQPTLKIPLKYQRKSKTSSEKHYKKKFCERNWEYDYDDLYENASTSGGGDHDGANERSSSNNSNNSSSSSQASLNKEKVSAMHHKASKFRPKGKDWDWSMEKKKSSNSVN